MTFDYMKWIGETRELVRKYGKLTPALEGQFYAVEVCANTGDTEEADRLKSEIELQIARIYDANIKNLPSFPVPEKTEGEIVFGRLFQGNDVLDEFKVPIKHFNRHIAIFAQPGHGKTVLLVNTMHQMIENKINFLAFDFKQDFRHLKDLPIVCLRWNWLRINPFKAPPGVDEFQWITMVCNLFSHVYGWFHASKNYLFEFANEEYQKNRNSGLISLQKVRESIESSTDRESERQRMKTVVLNRLSTLLTVCHEVLNCDDGFPIHELLNHPVVIEMDGCEQDEANFLVSLFLLYIFEYRKGLRHRGSLEHVVVFDEAHRIFYRQSEHREVEAELGSSVINQIPRIIRDYNEGLVFATQEPSQINNSVMANTDMKFVGYLGNGYDIEAIRKAFQLDDKEKKIIKKLKIGQFIVQKSGLNDGDPFLVKGYDYPIEKTVSDEEFRERMKDFIDKMQSDPKKKAAQETILKLPEISDKARKMMNNIGLYPLRKLSQRYKQLEIHPQDGKTVVSELVEKGLIHMKSIRLSTGRPSIYLEPTDLGMYWLKENGVETKFWTDYVGHVGLEHRVYQWLIAKRLENRGYNVKKEHTIGRKRLDVYAERKDSRIGIEVCVSPKMNFQEAVAVSENLDEVIFVCRDISVIQQMQREMASLDISSRKFRFVIGYNYLSDLYSIPSNTENNENNYPSPDSGENNP